MTEMSTPYYKILDLTLVFLACCVAYWVRFDTIVLPLYYFLPTAIFTVISTFALSITKFYQITNSQYSTVKAVAAASGLIVAAILTIACLYLTKTGENYSRIWLTTSVIFSFFFLVVARYILEIGFNISTGPRVIVLLGQGKTTERITKKLQSDTNKSIYLASTFNVKESDTKPENRALLEVLNYIEEYRKNIDIKHPIVEIWITHDIFSRFNHYELEKTFSDTSTSLVYVPEMPDLNIKSEKQVELVLGIPTINSNFSKRQKFNKLTKLIEDQVIAWIALITLLPIFIVIATLIKFDSPGPIIYKQTRYGLGGKGFTIWKFRTMIDRAPENQFTQASENDPRVTRIGAYLRRTSLDELPQLFNVLSGKMSIVGPRPHPDKLNEQYRNIVQEYMQRHTFKPGITGLAQINGYRGELLESSDMDNRVHYDLNYIKNWSLSLDIYIILKTFAHLITTDKAY